MNKKPFLTAEWKNLLLITYQVEPELLNEHIPAGIEPDLIDGKAFVSLVAFEFNKVKVKGFRFPFHVNFPEINLRYYVRKKEKRGVVFIKEMVPKVMISTIANILYNENYTALRMNYTYSEDDYKINIEHAIKYKGNKYYIKAEAENSLTMPPEKSMEHFFKEHEWGFGKTRNGRPLIYRVEHPHWKVFKINEYETNFDFGKIYGGKWKILNYSKPFNVTFAAGSAIKVYPAEKL